MSPPAPARSGHDPAEGSPWRAKTFEVIFEADTPGGKAFDVALIAAILLSVAVVMIDSVESVAPAHRVVLRRAEWVFTVLTVVVIVGSLLFLIEGPEAGFTSIPRAMYWAIVTLTTVGYGDIAPLTPVG